MLMYCTQQISSFLGKAGWHVASWKGRITKGPTGTWDDGEGHYFGVAMASPGVMSLFPSTFLHVRSTSVKLKCKQ
jgi:hypothetical protein